MRIAIKSERFAEAPCTFYILRYHVAIIPGEGSKREQPTKAGKTKKTEKMKAKIPTADAAT